MRTKDIFSYSFSAIRLRKLRAALTILARYRYSCYCGVAFHHDGMTNTIQNQLSQGLATDTLIVTTTRVAAVLGGDGNGGGVSSGGAASSNLFCTLTIRMALTRLWSVYSRCICRDPHQGIFSRQAAIPSS
jgi:hypothetical protein